MRNSNCTDCGLCKGVNTVCLYGEGPESADIMFIGRDPGENEDLLGRPFVGRAGVLLDELMVHGGIDRSKVYVTNIVKCRPPGNRQPTDEEKAACLQYLKMEIGAVNPKMIVVLGADALKTLTGLDKIMKHAGTVIDIDKEDFDWAGKVFVALHPSYLLRNASMISRAQKHFIDIGYYYKGEEPPRAPTNYTYITDFDRVEGFFDQLNKQTLVTFDLETDSLDFKAGNILCFSFSWKIRTGIVLPLVGFPDKKEIWTTKQTSYIMQKLKEAFGNKNISWIAHNISFDHKYLLSYNIDIAGNMYDTMLLQQLLDENAMDLKGLKALAATYTDMGRYDDPLDDFKQNLKAGKSKELTEAKFEKRKQIKMVQKALDKAPNFPKHIDDMETLKKEYIELEERKIDISYDMIPTDILWPYTAMDADATLRIFQHHWMALKKESEKYAKYSSHADRNMKRLYTGLTMPLRRVLNEMEFRGALMDEDYLHALDVKYSDRLQELQEALYAMPEVQNVEKRLLEDSKEKYRIKYLELKSVVQWKEYQDSLKLGQSWTKTVKSPRPPKYSNGDDYADNFVKHITFNLNSPAHLRVLLFEELGCDVSFAERTPAGALSTDKSVLEKWHNKPGVENLLENRKISKLHNTYVKGSLTKIANSSDKRIHTNFNQHITVTGRLSSSNPNLQNIPRKDKDIKGAFRADAGWGILQLDYAQAEFRMWCELSQDAKMLKDIKAGMDIHIQTASDFWGIPMAQLKADLDSSDPAIKEEAQNKRTAAKFVVFGLMYGRGAKSVAEQVGISKEDAETIKTAFFARYPAAAAWLDRTRQNAKQLGFVPGFFGRVRRLPYASSGDPEKAAEAMRQAVNSPIQGSAADVTGLGLIRIRDMLREVDEKTGRLFGDFARLILTVHDSIILEVKWEYAYEIAEKCIELMINKLGMSTPMAVDAEFGLDWAHLNPLIMTMTREEKLKDLEQRRLAKAA